MRILTLSLLLVVTSLAWAQPTRFQEGTHYERIESPAEVEDDGRVEVVEVFGYPCPHCHNFQPYIEEWTADLPDYVEFRRVPVIFQRAWEPFARAYYTAEVLDVLEAGHSDLFNALHEEGRRLRTIAELAEFWSDYGISAEEFKKTAGSFAVDSRLRKARSETGSWGVRGTPSVIVDNKWRVSARRGGSYEEMLQVVDYLVDMEAPETVGEEAESIPAEDGDASDS